MLGLKLNHVSKRGHWRSSRLHGATCWSSRGQKVLQPVATTDSAVPTLFHVLFNCFILSYNDLYLMKFDGLLSFSYISTILLNWVYGNSLTRIITHRLRKPKLILDQLELLNQIEKFISFVPFPCLELINCVIISFSNTPWSNIDFHVIRFVRWRKCLDANRQVMEIKNNIWVLHQFNWFRPEIIAYFVESLEKAIPVSQYQHKIKFVFFPQTE